MLISSGKASGMSLQLCRPLSGAVTEPGALTMDWQE